MKLILCLFLGSVGFTSSLRARRNVYQFGQMIECVTPRSATDDYNGYGCWCGLGGSGTPVDATDGCCRTHDHCYDALEDTGTCSSWDLYTESYTYYCYNCDTQYASISCGSGNSCEVGLCQCDKAAAECFRDSSFNSAYKDYDKDSNC